MGSGVIRRRGYCPAKTKGTFTGVELLDGGNLQPFMREAMQLDRPGKSRSPPLAEADSTLPEAPMVIEPLTRALVGAFAAREQVARYLARKPSGEVEKALRLLEVALGDAEKPKS